MKNILKLIKKGESQTTEFKVSVQSQIGCDICAFANTNDGTILVGVDNVGNIKGINPTEEVKISNIANSCDPPVRITVYPEVINQKTILIVNIRKTDKLHFYREKVYCRVGSSNRALTSHELIDVAYKMQLITFDSLIEYKAVYNKCADIGLIKRKIKEYEQMKGNKIITPPKSFLETLGSVKKLHFTNAGILLFSKNPQIFLPFAYIIIVVYPGKDIDIAYKDMKEFSGTLFEQIEKANDYLQNMNMKHTFITGKAQRKEIYNYPPYALRELLINAVVHRDYRLPNRIVIKVFSDRIEYHSPGCLPSGVTVDNILNKQKARNPAVFDVLYRWGYIEGIGDGLDRVFKSVKENSFIKRAPMLVNLEEEFLVTLYSVSEIALKNLEFSKILSLTELKVYNVVAEYKEAKLRDIGNALNYSKDKTYRIMKSLIKKKFVKTKGQGKTTRYVAKIFHCNQYVHGAT